MDNSTKNEGKTETKSSSSSTDKTTDKTNTTDSEGQSADENMKVVKSPEPKVTLKK